MQSLKTPLTLPCGVTLKNRLAKSAMSDSLADGKGNPSDAQVHLYHRWAKGGGALSIIGEVQGRPEYLEAPGNLVLNGTSQAAKFQALAKAADMDGHQLWLQLGHAGALSHEHLGKRRGPSALDLPALKCDALTRDEIAQLPNEMAATAQRAQALGFKGVEVHAGHGFLFSQFLSPLFNQRTDPYGGAIENRVRVIVDTISAIRKAVGPSFPIALKINSSDQLEGGLREADSLDAITILNATSLDLIDISGGTYFPGAKASSDAAGGGPYFIAFAERAKKRTTIPLMVTGGFKTLDQATSAVASNAADMIGMARSFVIDPDLGQHWLAGKNPTPAFPKFAKTVPGGVTAWYTMRITAIAEGREDDFNLDLEQALQVYAARDKVRETIWSRHFSA